MAAGVLSFQRESINTGLDYWNGGIVEWWTGIV